MKPGIHPTWYPEAVITCACGTVFVTGSTKKEIHTDVCSHCHPFFTGEQRIVDTAGQVERFMKRQGAKEKIASARPVADAEAKPAKKEKGRDQTPPPALKPVVAAPAELPLAMIEEKPVAPAPEPPVVAEPAMRFGVPQPEPVAEIKPMIPVPAPIAPEPPMPAPAPMPEPEPMVMEPVAVKPMVAKPAKKPAAKKAPAKKVAAPKAKAVKPKSAKSAKSTKPAKAAKKPSAKKPATKKKK